MPPQLPVDSGMAGFILWLPDPIPSSGREGAGLHSYLWARIWLVQLWLYRLYTEKCLGSALCRKEEIWSESWSAGQFILSVFIRGDLRAPRHRRKELSTGSLMNELRCLTLHSLS